jgi:BASS family bile acid:Na+ symporter
LNWESAGGRKTRIATSLIEPVSNTGPVFAAVAIGFSNDPAILSATTMLLFVQVFVAVFIASYLGKKDQPEPEEAATATEAR